MKKCSKCEKIKEEREFQKDRRCPDGLRSSCKECTKEDRHTRAIRRIANGNCPYCNNPNETGRYYCTDCSKHHKERVPVAKLVEEKLCLGCGKVKAKNEFSKNNRLADKLNTYCRECVKKKLRELTEQRISNGDCPRCGGPNVTGRYYCSACKHKQESNRTEEARIRAQAHDRTRSEKRRRTPEHKKWVREYMNRRYMTDINFRIRDCLRSRLHKALKNGYKAGSAVRDLGCSIESLKGYLESRFLSGMSWENHGSGKDKWNIDHIIALSSVDLTDREQLTKVCHYTNLRPLWQPDNVRRYFAERRVVS